MDRYEYVLTQSIECCIECDAEWTVLPLDDQDLVVYQNVVHSLQNTEQFIQVMLS